MLFADGDGFSLDFKIKVEHYFRKSEHGPNTAFTLDCIPLANSHSLSVTVLISHIQLWIFFNRQRLLMEPKPTVEMKTF